MESSASDYGPVYLGDGEMKKAITLPDELKDGGELSFSDFEAMGWSWNGEMHPLPGFHIVEFEDGCFGFEKDE